MTKIYLIRHAEAEGNIYRFAHGHYNGFVTVKGYRQIGLLRNRFLAEQIDAVYSSDLIRTYETAKALSEPRSLIIQTSKELREVNMGAWEDCAWGFLERTEPEMMEMFNKDPAKWSIPGSERFEDVAERMHRYITEIAGKHDGETVAVFSHGFAIRTLICRLRGVPSGDTVQVPYCDNTAVTKLNFENGEFTIEYAGDNAHITGKDSTLEQQSWWRAETKHKPENLRYMPLYEAADEKELQIYKERAGKWAQADEEFVALLGDEPVGVIGIDTKKEAEMKNGWLSYVFTAPNRRRSNFGVQMTGLAVSELRKLKRERLRIKMPQVSPGVKLMEKCSFTAISNAGGIITMEKFIKNW